MTADMLFDSQRGGASKDLARIAESSLARLSDPATFSRARECADTGAVIEVGLREDPVRLLGRVQGSRRTPYVCTAVFTQGSWTVTSLRGACSCPVVSNCKHVFALAITA